MATYTDAKRQSNLAKHGIDFADGESVFDSPMLTEEDTRHTYGEQRLRSLCWLNGRVAVLIWTDRESGPHFISCRYADKQETQIYFKAFV